MNVINEYLFCRQIYKHTISKILLQNVTHLISFRGNQQFWKKIWNFLKIYKNFLFPRVIWSLFHWRERERIFSFNAQAKSISYSSKELLGFSLSPVPVSLVFFSLYSDFLFYFIHTSCKMYLSIYCRLTKY